MPMHPIVSACGTATDNTTKFITKVLQNYCGKTSSFIKDSTDFVKKIKHVSVSPEEETLVSFDVSALFTSIPVPAAHTSTCCTTSFQFQNYLLSSGESYGLTAQYMQDCPIIFIQLNYVHDKRNKVLPPYAKLPCHNVAPRIPLPLSQFSHFA